MVVVLFYFLYIHIYTYLDKAMKVRRGQPGRPPPDGAHPPAGTRWSRLVQRELGGVPPGGGGLREGRLLLGPLGAWGASYKARRPPP